MLNDIQDQGRKEKEKKNSLGASQVNALDPTSYLKHFSA